MYILNLQGKIERRHERILKTLPLEESQGITVEELAKKMANEYSVATLRNDLKLLHAKGDVGCDEKRTPWTYWRKRQK